MRQYKLIYHFYLRKKAEDKEKLVLAFSVGSEIEFDRIIEDFEHAIWAWPMELQMLNNFWTFCGSQGEGLERVSPDDQKWKNIESGIKGGGMIALRDADYRPNAGNQELRAVLYITKI